MADEINDKIIERQLAILMTNSVAFSSKLYDMFVSSTPMDVEFNIWTSVDTFETITVPNRAKGNIPASYGDGSPEGNVEASYGTMYLDETDGSIYVKTTVTGSDGWRKIMTEVDLTAHDRSSTAHDGTLAKLDGAYSNGIYHTFKVANPVEDLDAVNKGSLDALLGGLDTLRTEDKTDVVTAINEVSEASNFDAGCAVSGISNVYTNYSSLLSTRINENEEYVLTVNAPCVVTLADGTKHSFTEDIEINLINAGVIYGSVYSIYLDLEEDTLTSAPAKIALKAGKFWRQARRPFVLAENDGWLDTGSAPYKFYLVVRDEESGELKEVEKKYVYLGELEQEQDGDD